MLLVNRLFASFGCILNLILKTERYSKRSGHAALPKAVSLVSRAGMWFIVFGGCLDILVYDH